MLMPSSMRDWLRLPSRIAMLLGLGALSVTGAKAGTIDAHPGRNAARIPQQSAKAFGELSIWQENGRIYVSEARKPAEELHLSGSAEAATLRQLLEKQGATAVAPHVQRDRVILVGAGGAGLHWESQQAGKTTQTQSSTTHNPTATPPDPVKTAEQGSSALPPGSINSNNK
jgi:hypothetical protein